MSSSQSLKVLTCMSHVNNFTMFELLALYSGDILYKIVQFKNLKQLTGVCAMSPYETDKFQET